MTAKTTIMSLKTRVMLATTPQECEDVAAEIYEFKDSEVLNEQAIEEIKELEVWVKKKHTTLNDSLYETVCAEWQVGDCVEFVSPKHGHCWGRIGAIKMTNVLLLVMLDGRQHKWHMGLQNFKDTAKRVGKSDE